MIAALLLLAQIMRPVDKAALAKGPLEIIAKAAPGAKLELDGQPIKTESPFPSVLTAKIDAAPGRHRLSLTQETGRHDVEISIGPQDGFAPYRAHPPGQTACTTCHGVSARGRFRFEGGCSNCHATAAFAIATAIFLRHRRWGIFALLAAAVLSVGRVAIGVHYPSDVLAGAALGAACALALWAPFFRARIDAASDWLGAWWDRALGWGAGLIGLSWRP